jgi:hypothetical protein
MILGLEIGLLIGGILALVRGKMNFSKNKVATGAPAYIAGVIMLLPIPLAFGIIFCYGFFVGARGGVIDEKSLRTTAIIIEVGIVLLCLAIAMLIAVIYGEPPLEASRKKRRERFEDEDFEEEDEDRNDRQRKPRRDPRAYDQDDDEEDRGPRKSRSRDMDDEDDENRRERRSRRPPRAADREENVRPERPRRPDDDRFKE